MSRPHRLTIGKGNSVPTRLPRHRSQGSPGPVRTTGAETLVLTLALTFALPLAETFAGHRSRT